MTRDRLDEMVPIMNAAMEDRTNIEWDKDDLDAVGMLKVDVLALGMLSCIRRAFDFMQRALRLGADAGHASRTRTRPSTTCSAGPIPSASSRSRAGRR